VLLIQAGGCVLWLCAGLHTGDFGWGSPTFSKIGPEKVRLIKTFLEMGVQVSKGHV
jgi:hypothetical protein